MTPRDRSSADWHRREAFAATALDELERLGLLDGDAPPEEFHRALDALIERLKGGRS